MEILMLVAGVILLVLSGMIVAASIAGHFVAGLADGLLQVFYGASAKDPRRERRELLLTALVVMILFSLGVALVKKSGSYRKIDTGNQPSVSIVK